MLHQTVWLCLKEIKFIVFVVIEITNKINHCISKSREVTFCHLIQLIMSRITPLYHAILQFYNKQDRTFFHKEWLKATLLILVLIITRHLLRYLEPKTWCLKVFISVFRYIYYIIRRDTWMTCNIQGIEL